MKWDAAKSACENLGSKLAVVNSEAKLRALAPKISMRAWIGLHRDPNNKSSWLWVDGSRVNYTNWNSGEPNNAHREHCVEIFAHSGIWNNMPCSKYLNYVCEINGKPESEL